MFQITVKKLAFVCALTAACLPANATTIQTLLKQRANTDPQYNDPKALIDFGFCLGFVSGTHTTLFHNR